ncbi:EamA family transporter RarD [Alcaligenaceae bacterium]|nr:EamA family transporter RarD [Alcaligenaceae bacterium]
MKQGIALSVLSSVLFAVLYYYVTLLYPLEGASIFAWRIVLGIPALALVITRMRGWQEIRTLSRRLAREPRLFFMLLLSACLIGVQLLLFVWAPLHQKGLDVSMGYFLLPLMMVLVGRFAYGERLTKLQTMAVCIAALGVVHELLRVYSFSWVTALVVLGYPPYFMLRRVLRTSSLSSLWFDMIFILPVAVFILQNQEFSVIAQLIEYPRLLGLIPVLGLISSVALVAYISASRMLPLGLFGILGYVEPVLLFWVAFLFLDETITLRAWFTYIPIWIAVALIVAEGAMAWTRSARSARVAEKS